MTAPLYSSLRDRMRTSLSLRKKQKQKQETKKTSDSAFIQPLRMLILGEVSLHVRNMTTLHVRNNSGHEEPQAIYVGRQWREQDDRPAKVGPTITGQAPACE